VWKYLDLEEEMVGKLLKFAQHVISGDMESIAPWLRPMLSRCR
jgi:hypothetical protein